MSVDKWQKQLNRFVDTHSVPASIETPDASTSVDLPLHIAKYTDQEIIADVDQYRRKAICTARDLQTYGVPKSGDKVFYMGERATIDLVDPRIEAGAVIGYDLLLRGDAV